MPRFFRNSYRIYQTGESQYGVFFRRWWAWWREDAYPEKSWLFRY